MPSRSSPRSLRIIEAATLLIIATIITVIILPRVHAPQPPSVSEKP